MIEKIISGGQTGADRAALDASIKNKIPHGGWIPKGRIAEDGKLPEKCRLQETSRKRYSDRTRKNVIDSDGTLIISHGKLTGGSLLTKQFAEAEKKICLHIDLNITIEFSAALQICTWIMENKIEILNVAGPRASKDPDIYQGVTNILERVIHFLKVESMALSFGPARTLPILDRITYPKTVDEAVDRLVYQLSLKDRVSIAKMAPDDIALLNLTMGRYIKNKFGLRDGNSDITRDCCRISGKDRIEIDEASAMILAKLALRLKGTHTLRMVK